MTFLQPKTSGQLKNKLAFDTVLLWLIKVTLCPKTQRAHYNPSGLALSRVVNGGLGGTPL